MEEIALESPAPKSSLPPWNDTLILLGLWSLAVAQPMLAIAGDHPEVLGAHPQGSLGLGVGLILGPPALFTGVRVLAQKARGGLGPVLHGMACGLLLVLLALQVLNRFAAPLGAGQVVALSLLAALAGLGAWRRLRAVRSLGTVLAWSSLLVALAALARLPGPGAPLPGAAGAGNGVPIVWVVFDELPLTTLLDPQGQVDARNFPSFARLAAEATWFRNATTVSASTPTAIPAMLSGRYPVAFVPPTAANYPQNLLQLARESHRVVAFEPMTAMSLAPAAEPESPGSAVPAPPPPVRSLGLLYARFVVPRALHGLLPQAEREVAVFAGADFAYDLEVRRLVDFIASIRPSPDPGRPTLHFLHSLLPHRPWRRYPSGRSFGDPVQDLFPRSTHAWSSQPWETVQAYATHLAQAAFADRILGDLVARLEAGGLYDRCVLVVVGDHGVSFVPGRDSRGMDLPAQVLRVPMLVKLPGQREGRVDNRPVETVDLLPTVLEAAGLEAPPGLDGMSLLDPERPPTHRRHFLTHAGWWQAPDEVPGTEETVAWKTRLLGPQGALDGLFRVAPGEGHFGQPLASVPPVPGLEVTLDRPEQYLSVSPAGSALPAPVSGTVKAPAGVDTVAVAVAVDGVVRADTLAWEQDGTLRFTALVPESAWHAGDHRVEAVATQADPTLPPDLLPPTSAY